MLRIGLPLALTVLVAACGGEGSSQADVAAMPQDTFIKPIEREPLTEADLAGMTMAELALELPWTRNRVSRDPAPGQPPSDIGGSEVAGHDGFDRVTFSIGDGMLLPGYEIEVAEAGRVLACESGDVTLDAERTLVVRFAPARWSGEASAGGSATRMRATALVCAGEPSVTWTATLGEGDQVRVLELRDPARVAVDIR